MLFKWVKKNFPEGSQHVFVHDYPVEQGIYEQRVQFSSDTILKRGSKCSQTRTGHCAVSFELVTNFVPN